MKEEDPKKQCRRVCKHWSYDMDSEYCAHPEAFKVSWAGVNLNRMRGPNGAYPKELMKEDPVIGMCGSEGKLWEPAPKK